MPDVTPIVDIISLAYHTGGLVNRRPVSVLLCSHPDNGKTTWIMGRFNDEPNIHVVNHMTRIGIVRWFLANHHWQQCHHIAIPDMTALLSTRGFGRELIHTLLMPLMFEGISEVHTFNMPNINLPRPLLAGIVAGITPSMYDKWKQDWLESGFLRRFLPLSFDYTTVQDRAIGQLCLFGRNNSPATLRINRTLWKQPISITDKVMEPLEAIAESMIKGLRVPSYTFKGHTFKEMLHSFVLAHAMRRSSREATSEDVAAVIRRTKHMNYNMEQLSSVNTAVSVNGQYPEVVTLEGSNVH